MHPDIWGGIVLLGFAVFLGAASLGWVPDAIKDLIWPGWDNSDD